MIWILNTHNTTSKCCHYSEGRNVRGGILITNKHKLFSRNPGKCLNIYFRVLESSRARLSFFSAQTIYRSWSRCVHTLWDAIWSVLGLLVKTNSSARNSACFNLHQREREWERALMWTKRDWKEGRQNYTRIRWTAPISCGLHYLSFSLFDQACWSPNFIASFAFQPNFRRTRELRSVSCCEYFNEVPVRSHSFDYRRVISLKCQVQSEKV